MDQFKLYIQPQVDIRTERPVAGEALVRWERQDGTLHLPGEFIPLFEENGFIRHLDTFILDTLCRQMRLWRNKGIPILPVAINQSRLNLEDPGYLNRFCATVDQYGIPHESIVFELTESAFANSVSDFAHVLRGRGFQLAIDDFGTGYTSLSLLGTVHADILKLDRSLIADVGTQPRSRAILCKVLELARELGAKTICEGVETREQMVYLKEHGCDIIQGFYYYRPMPAAQFAAEILTQGASKVPVER